MDNDLAYGRRLIQSAINHGSDGMGVMFLPVLPSLAMIAYETSRHLRGSSPERARRIPARSIRAATQARHNFKLLDNTGWGPAQADQWASEVYQAHAAAFRTPTMAVASYQGQLITSSALLCLHAGLDTSTLLAARGSVSPPLRDIAHDYSQYFDMLTAGLDWQGPSWVDAVDMAAFDVRNVPAKTYYKRLYPGVGKKKASVLSAIHASVNTADQLLTLDRSGQSAGPQARIQFLTAHHALSSLLRLEEHGLELPAKVRAAVAAGQAGGFLGDDRALLRNALVHYTLSASIPGRAVDLDDPWVGLTEHYCPDTTFTELAGHTAGTLHVLAGALGEWQDDVPAGGTPT